MTTYSASFLDQHRDINVNYDWWDSVYDDFIQICTILGIEIDNGKRREGPKIYFTGFCSQGDGASWEGIYRAKLLVRMGDGNLGHIATYDTAPAAIREHAPDDEKLHEIADQLCVLNRIYGPVFATVGRSRSNYYHENTMQIDVWEYYDDERNEDVPEEIAEHIEGTLLDLFQGLARWLYRSLEREYDYLVSDEAVAETLEANEIEEEKEENEECLD